MPIVVQPSLRILDLPREAQARFDGGLVIGRRGRGDAYLDEGAVLRRPDDDAAPVRGLDGRAEVVVVVIGDGAAACAVLGLYKKGSGGEFTVRPSIKLSLFPPFTSTNGIHFKIPHGKLMYNQQLKLILPIF
jgi:hypothetical protein